MTSKSSPSPTTTSTSSIGAEAVPPPREFTMRFSSTPRGARLARRLVSHRLDAWGHPYGSAANESLTLVTAELAANAVRHGHVPGRDFAVRLVAAGGGTLRVEVSDARAERLPLLSLREPPGEDESGRGLMLVAALADRWGAAPRAAGPGKTVWAEMGSHAPADPQACSGEAPADGLGPRT